MSCNPVDATLDELKTLPDAWLCKLDFGQSRWLFILAVEDIGTKASWAGTGGAGYAVVSGYLFDKQAAGDKLVWRDRRVGRPCNGFEGCKQLVGGKEETKLIESEISINDGARRLLATFETRNKRIQEYGREKVEAFNITCNMLWTALNDALRNSGKYETLGIYDSDRMFVYAVHQGKIVTVGYRRIGYIRLESDNNGCAMQITDTFPQRFLNDAGDLIKRVRESLLH